jgi:hypothetical protein
VKLKDSNKRNCDITLMTHEKIAEIMTQKGYPMCRGRVWQIEKSALEKIAANPSIRAAAIEMGLIFEDDLKSSS